MINTRKRPRGSHVDRPNSTHLLHQRMTQIIDKDTLRSSLDIISDHLYDNNVFLRLGIVGGPVDLFHLETWCTMSESIVFGWDLTNPVCHGLVKEGRQLAIDKSPVLLQPDWFNIENYSYMDPELIRSLTRETFAQDTVVYSGAGMTILAAPWEHAFAVRLTKLLTFGGGNPRAYYDLFDAVEYFHQIIIRTTHPLSIQVVEAWSHRFSLRTCRDTLMNIVNEEYRKRYQDDAIVITDFITKPRRQGGPARYAIGQAS